MSDNKITKGVEPLSFGVFSPVGYVVLALGTPGDVSRTRDALLGGGYDDEDILSYGPDEVVTATEQSFPDRGLLSHLGGEREAAERHQEMAREGCHFLLVRALTRDETNRVMNVARRSGLRLAHKYDKGSVAELT